MTKPHTTLTPAVADAELLSDLLLATSRTFALAIPLLPEPERTDVTLGYLVFRIADTLEDADNLGRDERIAALDEFAETLQSGAPEDAQRFAEAWSPRRPLDNADYQRLLEHTPAVLAALASRRPEVRQIVVEDACRSIAGMQATLRRAGQQGELECETIAELREYCYYVAGIVGEMLTRIFLPRLAGSDAHAVLEAEARWFGEGLQLVNILKDADTDASSGRAYLPALTPREEVLDLAADDLGRAGRYIAALREADAPAGVIAFCRAPHEMAVATLDRLRVDGPGAKITREQVTRILAAMHADTPVAPDAEGRG